MGMSGASAASVGCEVSLAKGTFSVARGGLSERLPMSTGGSRGGSCACWAVGWLVLAGWGGVATGVWLEIGVSARGVAVLVGWTVSACCAGLWMAGETGRVPEAKGGRRAGATGLAGVAALGVFWDVVVDVVGGRTCVVVRACPCTLEPSSARVSTGAGRACPLTPGPSPARGEGGNPPFCWRGFALGESDSPFFGRKVALREGNSPSPLAGEGLG